MVRRVLDTFLLPIVSKNTRTDKVLDTSSRYKNSPIVEFSLERTLGCFTMHCHIECSIDEGNGMYRDAHRVIFMSERIKIVSRCFVIGEFSIHFCFLSSAKTLELTRFSIHFHILSSAKTLELTLMC